jgi:hypothetical protein
MHWLSYSRIASVTAVIEKGGKFAISQSRIDNNQFNSNSIYFVFGRSKGGCNPQDIEHVNVQVYKCVQVVNSKQEMSYKGLISYSELYPIISRFPTIALYSIITWFPTFRLIHVTHCSSAEVMKVIKCELANNLSRGFNTYCK